MRVREGSPEERRYAEEKGEEALARVREHFAGRLPCCWELVEDGHAPSCPDRPDDEPDPGPPEGQGSLL